MAHPAAARGRPGAVAAAGGNASVAVVCRAGAPLAPAHLTLTTDAGSAPALTLAPVEGGAGGGSVAWVATVALPARAGGAATVALAAGAPAAAAPLQLALGCAPAGTMVSQFAR